MPVRITALPPDASAAERVLERLPARIGRDPGCELAIDHASVSRLHACIEAGADGVPVLRDSDSKNGIYRDGRRVDHCRIDAPLWCLLGDVFCEIEPLDAARASVIAARSDTRRQTSRALTAQLQAVDADRFLGAFVAALVELAGGERGYLLRCRPGAEPRVVAAHGADRSGFAGSSGVLQRALEQGRPVVAHDTAAHPWLAARASIAGGIAAVACVPLSRHGQVHAAAYVDSRRPGQRITALDLELIEAFAEQAALRLDAAALDAALQGV